MNRCELIPQMKAWVISQQGALLLDEIADTCCGPCVLFCSPNFQSFLLPLKQPLRRKFNFCLAFSSSLWSCRAKLSSSLTVLAYACSFATVALVLCVTAQPWISAHRAGAAVCLSCAFFKDRIALTKTLHVLFTAYRTNITSCVGIDRNMGCLCMSVCAQLSQQASSSLQVLNTETMSCTCSYLLDSIN